MLHLVFVYGTLRQGESNHHYLQGSEYLGLFETEPCYQLFNLGPYPGVVAGNDKLIGEIYRITEEVLAQLDILEDIPNEYIRNTIETPYGTAWIYIYQPTSPLEEAIASGNWLYRNQ